MSEADRIRAALVDLAAERRQAEDLRGDAMTKTAALVRQGKEAGIRPTELVQLTGLARQTIYDLLQQPEEPE